jgi:hypothetical protein
MKFNVVIGSPNEKIYDRLIKLYNGRIVGVFKKDVRLMDNKLYDVKHYEIFKDDFEKAQYKDEIIRLNKRLNERLNKNIKNEI